MADPALLEAMSSLKAGFAIFDGDGLPLSKLNQVFVGMGLDELTPDGLARFRERVVDEHGKPFAPGFTPVSDAISGKEQMDDLVIGIPPDGVLSIGEDPVPLDLRKVHWLRLNSRQFDDGGADRTLITAVDVSSVRATEYELEERTRELRESERRYSEIVHNAAEGIWVIDSSEKTVFANRQMAEMLGLTVEEMLGTYLSEFVTPDGREDAARRMEARQHGAQFHGEVRYLHKSGRVVETRLSSAPLFDAEGEYEGSLALVTDLTDERARQRELEEAVEWGRRRFDLLFQHMSDIVTAFDAAGRVIFASPAAERILGYGAGYRDPEGLLGVIHPDDRDAAAEALAQVVDGTRAPTEGIVLRARTVTGDWRYLECVGVNLLEQPEIKAIVVTARDVTERHRLTMELEHAASHDQLTGVPNRFLFDEHLAHALARSARKETHVSLCYLDLDGFKLVNDRFGHAAGDQLLVEAASRIKSCIRAGDLPCRLGGDEFALIIEETNDDAVALLIASRVRDRLGLPYDID
ncbi:MAG TPA: PAS domain S-box protein, partial [Acidimicrobiales bacterium]|nr:PAS domain S-box protein [Acidimicrobiales bacterium]